MLLQPPLLPLLRCMPAHTMHGGLCTGIVMGLLLWCWQGSMVSTALQACLLLCQPSSTQYCPQDALKLPAH